MARAPHRRLAALKFADIRPRARAPARDGRAEERRGAGLAAPSGQPEQRAGGHGRQRDRPDHLRLRRLRRGDLRRPGGEQLRVRRLVRLLARPGHRPHLRVRPLARRCERELDEPRPDPGRASCVNALVRTVSRFRSCPNVFQIRVHEEALPPTFGC